MATVKALIAASPLPRLEAHMLLQHVLKVPRVWLIAHDTDPLAVDAVTQFQALQRRRQQGEPMAYLVGEREFMGHRFMVKPGVLIPRPETEVLVEQALTVLDKKGPGPWRVLDLGTGSGAIAVSIALARPDVQVVASDTSDGALGIAQTNATCLGAKVAFVSGDWYQALPSSMAPFDVIVSNPPYIVADDPHLSQGDLRYEPAEALTDAADGLTAIRQIVTGAHAWLTPGGQLWVEHGYDQAEAVRSLLTAAGFVDVASLPDLAGIPRVTGGPIMF